MKLNRTQQKAIVEKIVNSRTFERSVTGINLLNFLFESTVEGRKLKETTLGIEFYGEDYLDKTNSSHIRVSIYHLRKKIEKYYAEEGIGDEWKLIIDKGQYHVSFIKNPKIKGNEKDYQTLYKRSVLVITLLGLGTLALMTKIFYKAHVPIWQSLLTNTKETTVVVGDFFGYMGETPSGRIGWIRDYEINSLEDFYTLQKSDSTLQSSTSPSNYNYITGMGAFATYHLSKLFTESNIPLTIRFSSKTNYDDIKGRNTIYIGPIKNENKFMTLFNQSKQEFKITDQQIHYKSLKTDTIINMVNSDLSAEYAIVSKLVNTDGTSQMLFFSDHDIGVMATVEYFTEISKLNSFFSTYLNESNQPFTAIFHVSGQERTNLDLKLILVETEPHKPY